MAVGEYPRPRYRPLGAAGCLTIILDVVTLGNERTTKALRAADYLRGIVRHMMIHVVLTGEAGRTGSLEGLCGAPIVGLYLRKVEGQRGTTSHLCPFCKATARIAEQSSDPPSSSAAMVVRAHFAGRPGASNSTPERSKH